MHQNGQDGIPTGVSVAPCSGRQDVAWQRQSQRQGKRDGQP
jgi:hypothetical protein